MTSRDVTRFYLVTKSTLYVTRFYLVRKSTLYEINRSYLVLH